MCNVDDGGKPELRNDFAQDRKAVLGALNAMVEKYQITSLAISAGPCYIIRPVSKWERTIGLTRWQHIKAIFKRE